ncbi:MAG: hypothetical protein NVS2B12_15530 [Ktedonobacteraceae bacterium]
MRILVQPNPYPLEQPGAQPDVSDAMPPQMQQGAQPVIPGVMPPPMQQGGFAPAQPPMPQGPATPQMQQGGFAPAQAPMPQGAVALTPGQVVPMQSNGQWRGDPKAQATPAFQQGNNQQWSPAPQMSPGALHPNMPQQPQQPAYPPQQRPGNTPQQPVTPPQLPGQPYNNAPMQQGRGAQPQAAPSQPLSRPGITPAPAQAPMQPPYQHTPPQPQQPPMAGATPPNAGFRKPSNSGLLANPVSQSGLAGPTSLPGTPASPALNAPRAHIFIEIDGKRVQEVKLDKPVMTIGRQDGRDIQIKHQSVSRAHARILAENGTWFIEDAGSVNGLVFHNQRIQRTSVSNGDRVFIAPNIVLIYNVLQ